jgi:hypothetical protein
MLAEKIFSEAHFRLDNGKEIEDGKIIDIYEGLEIDEESGDFKGLNAEIKKAYLESEKTIETKARDMIEHYLTHVYPNGYKAQVVASSQKAAVKYKKIIDKILEEKVLMRLYSEPTKGTEDINVKQKYKKMPFRKIRFCST